MFNRRWSPLSPVSLSANTHTLCIYLLLLLLSLKLLLRWWQRFWTFLLMEHTKAVSVFYSLSDDMLGHRKLSVVWRKFLCLAQQAYVKLVQTEGGLYQNSNLTRCNAQTTSRGTSWLSPSPWDTQVSFALFDKIGPVNQRSFDKFFPVCSKDSLVNLEKYGTNQLCQIPKE